MAFCRSVFFNSSLHPTPHQVLSKSTRSFLTCPFKLSKFTKLPPQHQKPYSAIIYSTLYMSSASSSMESPPPMESPPEGYRKNVGICLINPSKKVKYTLKLKYLQVYLFIYDHEMSIDQTVLSFDNCLKKY